MKIGAQFYTIREFCKDLNSFEESLKKVADIGYQYVQISGTCQYEAKWLKEKLDQTGLKCVITHNPLDMILNNTETLIKNHNIFDCKHIGLGGFGFDKENEAETLEKMVTDFTPALKTMRENGKYFMYHNHSPEFKKINGKTIMEHIAERFDKNLLGFTLDTYWVQVGGADPALYLEKLKDRVPCIHLKDYAYGQKMAVVGEGNLNFERIFQRAEEASTEYMLVEQDDCNGENPFDCLERSYKNLKAFGF